MYEATIPSFVARVAFFAAVAMPFVRRIVSAFSKSPPLSTRARLQSINRALVFSRSCLTSFGSISVVVFIRSSELLKRQRIEPLKRVASGRYACHFHLFAYPCLAAGRNYRVDQFLQNHSDRTYCFLRLFFAADKQNPAAATRDLLQEISCTPELPHSFIKIDNVNLVALFKDEGLHLGIPTLRLMSKMNTSLQQFRH